MEKKSYISSLQIIAVLFISRLLFSASYQSGLKAGNSIQDILLSIPVNFIINFIIAVPILLLLSRHPGHDLVECAAKVGGKPFGAACAVLYFLFFIGNAALVTGNFENYFTALVIIEVQSYLVGIFILIVCVYGALKGIETIARVGGMVAVFYLMTFAVILLPLLPLVDLSALKPIFYKGVKLFSDSIVMNYNLNVQIIALAFLAPFIRQGGSLGKTYTGWNVFSMIMLFILEFNVVTVTGAYGAKQMYPLQTLAVITHISIFERIEAIDMISWILNAVITITLYLYLAVSCLLKTGLNKHRRVIAIISGAAVLVFSGYISKNFSAVQGFMGSLGLSVIITVFSVVIPLTILIGDIIKKRVADDEKESC